MKLVRPLKLFVLSTKRYSLIIILINLLELSTHNRAFEECPLYRTLKEHDPQAFKLGAGLDSFIDIFDKLYAFYQSEKGVSNTSTVWVPFLLL